MTQRAFLCRPCQLALLAIPAAWAASPRLRLRYGGDAAFAPFESLDAMGRMQGFQLDLLAELGPLAGVQFDVQLRPWAQTEAAFRQGQLDVVAMVDTSERRHWALFTRGHATPALTVYHRQGRTEPQGLQDLVGLRVAVLDGEAMRDTLARWLSAVPGPFVLAADATQCLAAVQQGKADVALLPHAYADPVLRAGTVSGVVAGHMSLGLQTYALAVAPGQEALRERLQAGLDELERSGRLEALRTRWLGSHRDVATRKQLHSGLTQQRGWTWGLGGASALALLGMGLWLRRRGQRLGAERERRHQAEAALKRAEKLLERSFAQHPEPMLVVESGSLIVRDANAALQALLGVSAMALLGHSLDKLGQHLDAQALQQLVQALAETGTLQAQPLRLRRSDGSSRECLISADRLSIGGQPHAFCLLRDVTDQLAHDAALRSGYDALAERLASSSRALDAARAGQARAEGALNEFTRTVAHDLRSPLNAVQGLVGLLRQRLLQGHVQEALGCTDRIAQAAQRMNNMISALSGLAQVTQRPIMRQSVDMQTLARGTWSLLCHSHPERHAEFRLEALPAAHADADLAAQVWQNLLDNAFKYSTRAPLAKISVDSFKDPRGTWYRITDNGAGFDMARASALFKPFQRLHSASQFQGTGVGLSLVRRIIDHHEGEIRLRSAPGVGTVAEFTFDPPPAAG